MGALAHSIWSPCIVEEAEAKDAVPLKRIAVMTVRTVVRMADGTADEVAAVSLILPDLVKGCVIVSFFMRVADIE